MSEKRYAVPFRCDSCKDVHSFVSTATEEKQVAKLYVFCPTCMCTNDVAFLWNNKEVFKPGYHTANP